MATQGLVSILWKKQVKVKIVAGCNGYQADRLVELIEFYHPQSLEGVYHLARQAKFGCQQCLVVMDKDQIYSFGNMDEPGVEERYWRTFAQPDFNPRSEQGSAEYVRVARRWAQSDVDDLEEQQ